MSAAGAPAGGGAAAARVLLCDDSGVVRGALRRLLSAEPDIRVVAEAANGREALAALDGLAEGERPQVVLLDLEMPVMDGMTALPRLLQGPGPRPCVIVASALTQRGAAAAMAALRAGASDYIPKPGAAGGGGLADPAFRAELLAKVRGWARVAAAAAPARPRRAGPPPAVPGRAAAAGGTGEAARGGAPSVRVAGAPLAIAIGCSTGGPQALSTLVRRLGPAPVGVPVLVVQHMPAGFTAMLADHLNRLGGLPCAEARHGEDLLPDRIYIAPGDRHLAAEAAAAGDGAPRSGPPGPGPARRLVARLSDGPAVNFCRPAADPLLRSLAAACGGRVLAVILTGMGQDGLEGCRAVAAAGGTVLAQDEASAVVWGMPGAVARAGLARALLPPEGLADVVREAMLGAAAGRGARPAVAAPRPVASPAALVGPRPAGPGRTP